MKRLVLVFALLLSIAAETARADQAVSGESDCVSRRGAVSLLPTWYHNGRNNYSGAFTSNGFSAPSDDRVGLGVLIYWITATDWQIGLGVAGLSLSQDTGGNEASYEDEYIGVYFAMNLAPDQDYDVTLGALVGGGQSKLEVFSNLKNGKFTETAAVLEPRLGFAYRLGRFTKLGLMASYLFPFASSSDLKGQDLGVSRISTQGVSVAVQLVLGRFDFSSN